jgi:hypothetical protein
MLYKFHRLATTFSVGNNPVILSQVEQNLSSALSVTREENASILFTNYSFSLLYLTVLYLTVLYLTVLYFT